MMAAIGTRWSDVGKLGRLVGALVVLSLAALDRGYVATLYGGC